MRILETTRVTLRDAGRAVVRKKMKSGLILAFVVAAAAGFGRSASATVVDLTTSDSGTINGAQFVFTDQQPTGTGVIDPFLREQVGGSGGIEQGYNTSGTPVPFDDKPGPWTHNITVGDLNNTITTLNGTQYYTLLLDVNEPGGSKSLVSLDQLNFYTSTTGSITSTNTSDLGTLRYSLDAGMDSFVLIDAARNHGSGSGDVLAYIPVANFAGTQSSDYVYLYALFGQNHSTYGDTQAQGGFEEWSLVNNAAPVPEMSALFPIVGLLVAACATQHVRKRNARRLALARKISVG